MPLPVGVLSVVFQPTHWLTRMVEAHQMKLEAFGLVPVAEID